MGTPKHPIAGRLRVLLLALCCLGALAPAAAADVLVAVAGPAHGPKAAIAQQIRRGAQTAAERINAGVGVLGEPIAITAADDGCGPSEAEEAARRLLARQVALVIGHPCASAAIAAAKVYAQAGVPFIAIGARHPALTEPRAGPTIFRLAGRDDRQGVRAGAYLAHTFAGRPVAVVRDASRYAKELADGALSALKAAGHDNVLTATIAGAQKDFTPLVAKLAEARTQALFFAGFPLEGSLLLRQMRAAGLTTVFLGADALATAQFADTAGKAAEGAGVLLPFDGARQLPPAKARATFPRQTPTGPLVSGYAAVEAWSAAVRQAHAHAAAPVSSALQSRSFDTVLGKVSFAENGDADVPSYDILWRKNGAWRRKD